MTAYLLTWAWVSVAAAWIWCRQDGFNDSFEPIEAASLAVIAGMLWPLLLAWAAFAAARDCFQGRGKPK